MKQQIVETSLKQFLKYGIREMSIQKLIEPLGISTKTVYKYFKNKEDLLEEALHLYYAEQYQLLENYTASQNPVHLLYDVWLTATVLTNNVNSVFFRDLHYYYPELEKKIEESIAKRFTEQFIAIIKKGMQEGVFSEDIDPAIVLEAIYTLYNAISKSDQFKGFKKSSQEVLLNTIGIAIRGICTGSGVEELDRHIQEVTISDGIKVFKETMTVI